MEGQNQLENFFNLSFDATARDQLKKITMWAKICALLAFAGYILTLIITIFNARTVSVENNLTLDPEGGFVRKTTISSGSVAGTVVVIIIGAMINYFLYKFATAAAQGLEARDPIRLNEGLGSLRTYFKIIGILLLIALVIFGLVIVFGLLSTLTNSNQ